MRFLILLIIIIFLAFSFWPEQPTPTAEESFIGPQLEPLKKAEQFEQNYLDAVEQKNQRMEEQSDNG
jgi:hypothetical protein